MVDFLSERSGPRRDDDQARRLIEANRPTIERLADHLSNGAWSARNQPKRVPQAEGLVIHTARASTQTQLAKPFVRIAINGRVSVVDANTGRQMHHLGDVRRRDGQDRFRLATRANGFFSPVDPDIADSLADLDGALLANRDAEREFVAAIGARIAIA